MFLIICVLFTVSADNLSLVIAQDPFKVVSTPIGPIRGLLVDVTGMNSSVYQYKGIPYAKPPVGNLRFSKPEKIESWSEVFNATEFAPACPQSVLYPVQQSEDCLYLNVYVPHDTTGNKSVMIFIHGGGYVIGWGHSNDGSYLASVGDVIVVTINYRLGLLGFISTMDSVSPGNNALWDQHMAIKWVSQNIAAFGGNPSSITLFGESAGAFSVAFQSLYPGNKGLFHNIILQSGVGNSPSAVGKFGSQPAFTVGKFLNCSIETSGQLIACLRTKPYKDLIDASGGLINLQKNGSLIITAALAPVVDKEFVLDNAINLLQDKTSDSFKLYNSLNVIIGFNSAEGALLLTSAQYPTRKVNITAGISTAFVCDDLIPALVTYFYSNNQDVADAMCDFYKVPQGDTSAMGEQARKAVELFGDVFFNAPSMVALDAHQQTKNTYQYVLSMPGNYGGVGKPYPSWYEGTAHASDLAYLFGMQRIPMVPEEQLNLSAAMLTYWTNFAKTGNPNGNNTKEYWPRYESSSQTYLDLKNPVSQKKDIFKPRMQFWNKQIPGIIQQDTRNTPSGTIIIGPGQLTVCLFCLLILCISS